MTRRGTWGFAVAMTAGVLAAIATGGVVHAQAPPPASRAQSYVDPARGLTVDELVATALARAPEVLASRVRIDAARADETQAGLRPNPAISVDWREDLDGMARQIGGGIAWPLDLFRRGAREQVAAAGLQGAEAAAGDRDRQVEAAVRLQAARLLAAVRQLEIREAVAASTRQTRDLIAARAEAGSAPEIDRDVATVEWQRTEVEVRRQRADVEAAAAALRASVGLGADDALVLRETLEAVATQPDRVTAAALSPEAIAQAIAARPDLREADAGVRREEARQALLHQEARFDVSLVASYMRMRSGFPQLGLTPSGQPTPIRSEGHAVTVGAMVMLPWLNRNQGSIASATAAAEVAKHDRDARRLAAESEIATARARATQAREALTIFAGGIRDLASKNVDVMRESYTLGRATLLDVLTETRRYLDVETAYTAALMELVDARVALAAALGVRP